MNSRKKQRASIQQLHMINAFLNAVFICILCGFVAYYSFALERARILQNSHLPHLNLLNYYASKHDNLWRIYMPVVTDKDLTDAFADFAVESPSGLSVSTRLNLSKACSQLLLTDTDIVGLIFHSNSPGGVDYMYDRFSCSLVPLTEDSPFFNCLSLSNERIITGSRQVSFPLHPDYPVYGISGLFPPDAETSGRLLVLYASDPLASVFRTDQSQLKSDVLLLTASGEVIYDSTGLRHGQIQDTAGFLQHSGSTMTLDGEKVYVQTTVGTRSRYLAVCFVPADAVTRLSHKNTPPIICFCLMLILISALCFLFTSRTTTRRVRELTQGIDRIGRQELDFRFPIYGTKDEFDQIALRINQMTEDMQRSIEQVYIYSIREKSAEMGELQAKFNPHFLYNTLEVIRSHLHQKGDDDTADMIVRMSRVFRSALNNSHFTTLRSECHFINSYLDIYRWRYQDSFDVIYDVDTTLLNCGIIRNILQPLIENYFVHGFSPESPNNQLVISGQPDGTDHILLTVEDNGLGMSPERLEDLNRQLVARDNQAEAGGYGLVNLNDRIRLFYGSDCGLSISSLPDHYTTIRMRIRRMSLEEHETWIRQK